MHARARASYIRMYVAVNENDLTLRILRRHGDEVAISAKADSLVH